MQLRLGARTGLRALCRAAFLLIALSGVARADEASGSWSGSLEGRGN